MRSRRSLQKQSRQTSSSNATDVDGVYTSDPSKDSKATKLDEVTVDRLSKILSKYDIRQGHTT